MAMAIISALFTVKICAFVRLKYVHFDSHVYIVTCMYNSDEDCLEPKRQQKLFHKVFCWLNQ